MYILCWVEKIILEERREDVERVWKGASKEEREDKGEREGREILYCLILVERENGKLPRHCGIRRNFLEFGGTLLCGCSDLACRCCFALQYGDRRVPSSAGVSNDADENDYRGA